MDGAGGWYVGGYFTSLDGAERTHLAHVLADGTVDPAFAPVLESGAGRNGARLAEAGGKLYVGGDFSAIAVADRAGGDRLTCGPGRDTVQADRGDRIARDCERVRRT